jgi:hypothetical protein
MRYWKLAFSVMSLDNLSNDFFSYSKTSKPAPRIFPLFNPLTKSFVITQLPLAVLISQKGFLQLLMNELFIIPFDSFVIEVCRLITSEFSFKKSIETGFAFLFPLIFFMS